jgi:hypothetical protein
MTMGEHVRAGDIDIWTQQVAEGPDVLLTSSWAIPITARTSQRRS